MSRHPTPPRAPITPLNAALRGGALGLLFPIGAYFLRDNSNILFAIICSAPIVLATVAHLTQRHHRELEQEKRKTSHSAKLASLGEMSAGVAHEINNPLAIVVQQLESLERHASDPIKLQSKIRIMQNAVSRIEKIVGGLSKYSRASDGRTRKEEQLAPLVAESLVFTDARARRANVQVTVDVPQNLTIACDAIEIGQVLVNLINNGIDAARETPGKWVKISGCVEGEHVVLRIIDSGNGIPADIAEHLFQPFFTTKPIGQGTGLGLSITQRLLEQHGATLALDSKSSNTCFEIRFPSVSSQRRAA